MNFLSQKKQFVFHILFVYNASEEWMRQWSSWAQYGCIIIYYTLVAVSMKYMDLVMALSMPAHCWETGDNEAQGTFFFKV